MTIFFFRNCKKTGYFIIVFSLGILLTFILPAFFLVIIECLLLIFAGWLLIK